MTDAQRVVHEIENAGCILHGDRDAQTGNLEACIKRAQQDSEFRYIQRLHMLTNSRGLAGSPAVWKALHNTLASHGFKFDPADVSLEVLQSLLRLVQYLIAGVSDLASDERQDVIDMSVFNGTD